MKSILGLDVEMKLVGKFNQFAPLLSLRNHVSFKKVCKGAVPIISKGGGGTNKEFSSDYFLGEKIKLFTRGIRICAATDAAINCSLKYIVKRPSQYKYTYFRESYMHKCSTFIICVPQESK